MNARAAAILLVLLAVLGGSAIVLYQQDRERRPEGAAALGQPLFPGLKAADVRAIRIAEPEAVLTLESREEGWVIAERDGFPADLAKVRDFVIKAIGLKVGRSEPLGEKERARLNLDDTGTRVEFKAADGRPLAAVVAGRKHFRQPPEDPAKAPGDGRFVLLSDRPKTAYLVSDPLVQASAKTADWIERTSFQVEKVKTLEVRYPDGSGWRIERTADNADWGMPGARPDEKIEITRANSASYSLSLLELADVAPKDASPAETGLDEPTLVNATTLDGLAYQIKVGKLVGDNYYVAFASSGTPGGARVPEKDESAEDKERRDKEHAERLKKLEERLPREKLLSRHVLLIPKAKLEDTLKKRSELLEQKEDNKQ
jgi:hypothetical protein